MAADDCRAIPHVVSATRRFRALIRFTLPSVTPTTGPWADTGSADQHRSKATRLQSPCLQQVRVQHGTSNRRPPRRHIASAVTALDPPAWSARLACSHERSRCCSWFHVGGHATPARRVGSGHPRRHPPRVPTCRVTCTDDIFGRSPAAVGRAPSSTGPDDAPSSNPSRTAASRNGRAAKPADCRMPSPAPCARSSSAPTPTSASPAARPRPLPNSAWPGHPTKCTRREPCWCTTRMRRAGGPGPDTAPTPPSRWRSPRLPHSKQPQLVDRSGTQGRGGYPMPELRILVGTGTRTLIGAVFGVTSDGGAA